VQVRIPWRRLASYDHGVEVVRVFTIHTSFDPVGVSGQGLPSHKARIGWEQLEGVQRISLECVPFNLALPYQNRSGSPGGQLCRETKNLMVLKRPDSGLGLAARSLESGRTHTVARGVLGP